MIQELSADKYPTCNLVVPFLVTLEAEMTHQAQREDNSFKDFADVMASGLKVTQCY